MRPLVAIRWTSATWLIPTLFALGVYIALANDSRTTSYPVFGFANASRLVILVGPLLAVGCAVAFARVDNAISAMRPTRAPIWWLGSAMWPLLIGGPLAGAVSMVTTLRRFPGSASEWAVVAVTVCCLLACGSAGVLFAKALPLVAALPLVSLGTYAWLALPATTLNSTLRFMNGSFVDCCGFAYRPAPTMVAGSLAFAATLTASAFALTGIRRWWDAHRLLAGLLGGFAFLLAFGLSAGTIHLASDKVTLPAVVPRHDGLSCADGRSTEVCVWVENLSERSAVITVVDSLNQELKRIALPELRLVTEQVDASEGTVIKVPSASENLIKINLIQGMLARVATGCDHPTIEDGYQDAFLYLVVLTDIPETWLNGAGYATEGLASATALASSPTGVQRLTVKDLLNSLAEECDE